MTQSSKRMQAWKRGKVEFNVCGGYSVNGPFRCRSDDSAGDLSESELQLTETLHRHVCRIFLVRPHMRFSVLISSTGPVITEKLRHHMAARCCSYHWDEAAGRPLLAACPPHTH